MTLNNKRLFILIFLKLLSSICFGQEAIHRDIIYDQTTYSVQSYFPTLYQNNEYEIFMLNKFYYGALNPIRSFLLNGGIETSKNQRLHFIMNNYKEGDFFNKSRFYLNYSYLIELSRRQKLGVSVTPGLVHYNFKGSLSSAGGSSTAFDLNINSFYTRKNLKIGISYNQIPQSIIRPISYVYQLSNSFMFLADKKVDLSPNANFNFILLYEKFKDIQYLELGGFCALYDHLKIGYMYQYKKNMSVQAGVQDIKIKTKMFDFLVSYNFPTIKFGKFASNSIEFTLGLKSL